MQPPQPPPYEFLSEENGQKWRGLLVPALRKVSPSWRRRPVMWARSLARGPSRWGAAKQTPPRAASVARRLPDSGDPSSCQSAKCSRSLLPPPFGVLQFTSREGSLPSLREPPPSGHAPSHLSIKLPCLSPMLSVAPQAPGDLTSELSFSATDLSQRIALQVACSASNLCRANGLRGFWVGLCLSSTYLTRFL